MSLLVFHSRKRHPSPPDVGRECSTQKYLDLFFMIHYHIRGVSTNHAMKRGIVKGKEN